MFGIGGRSAGVMASGRDAVCEALLGEYIRGLSNLGYASIRFEASDSRLLTKFLAVGDPILRSIAVGIDRPAGKKLGEMVLVTVSAEAQIKCFEPKVLAKLHKTALDHIASAPSVRGVKLLGHWNSIVAYVEMDVNPHDFVFKGSVGASLIEKILHDVIADLSSSIKPYIQE